MSRFTSRPYAGKADLQAMIDLLIATRPIKRITDYPSIIDLHHLFGQSEMVANTRLWEDGDGRLMGFAIFVGYVGALYFEISPEATHTDIAVQLIAWGMQRLRNTKQSDAPLKLQASCRADNAERIALLERHGFVRQDWHTLHFVCPLDKPIPEPQVPEGFTIRHVEGEHEVEALVTLHRAAFGTDNMTIEGRLSWMRAPGYDPELDLVAIAPDGTLAAYALCSIGREENALTGRSDGYTDPVGTHPKFQRQGLARALLLMGFRLLRDRGVETAKTSTSDRNMAMQQTAKSVGYRAESTTIFFEKPVPEL